RAARQARERAGVALDALTAGDKLTAELAAALELPIAPLPERDPLLAGARALLDRAPGLIAVNGDLPHVVRTFCLAHELGHALLHTDAAWCGTGAAPEPDAPGFDLTLDPALLETYSPWQRREAEANAFAAELLLPTAAVRAAFLGTGGAAPLNPAQIAAAAGVAEGLALTQLSRALLGGGTEEGTEGADTAAAPHALDPDQEAAATVASGPVAVDAGPGSGKTRTLVARVAHLLASGAAKPSEVLVLTFSTAAAAELRRRLDALAPGAAVTVSTVHGWALDTLRRYSEAAGLPFDLRVLDGFAERRLLEGLLPRLPLVHFRNLHDPGEPLTALLRAISRAQDEAWSPEEFAARATALREQGAPEAWVSRAAETAAVYGAYLDALERRGAVDFGEIVARPTGGAGGAAGAVPRGAGGRIPGHQPGGGAAAAGTHRRRRRAMGGGRCASGDLPLPRRRARQLQQHGGRLPRRPPFSAAPQLPFPPSRGESPSGDRGGADAGRAAARMGIRAYGGGRRPCPLHGDAPGR
ncbi:MAG: UvrD-helicase domain-containing protein, partial [Chloroflexi bacterium]|nr:UvrD-helicase domain-containing protein [Chloroflexota bacterium]